MISADNTTVRRWRGALKHIMLVDRGGERYARCDLCGKPHQESPLEMHELINRGRTVNNPAARLLSYKPQLVALLCSECHSKAHNPEVRDDLFRLNYQRYGYSQVLAAYLRVDAAFRALGIPLDIELPAQEIEA